MKRKSLGTWSFITLVSILALASCRSKGPVNQPVVTIGGSAIEGKDFIANFNRLAPKVRPKFVSPEGRREFLSSLMYIKVLCVSAEEQGFAPACRNDDLFAAVKKGSPIHKYQAKILVQKFKVSDAEMRRAYLENRTLYSGKYESYMEIIETTLSKKKADDWLADRKVALNVQIDEKTLDALSL